MADDSISLVDFQPHECCIIGVASAPDDEMERLMAMGVCGDRTVELIQLGNPLILKVYGTRVGVAKRLAAKVRVHRCDPDPHMPA